MTKRGKSCNHRLLLSSIAAIIIGSGTFLVVGTAWFLALGLPKPSQILTLIHPQKLS
jgi:hypothetical protein